MICQRWSHRTEEGKLLNWLEICRALKALMFWHFLLSSPQCAFLTGDQLRTSEWWQSAARGEYTPLPFSSYSFTEWPRILIWISSGAQLHVCEGMQYLHSPVMSCPTLQAPSPGACLISFDFAGGRGGAESEVQLHSDTFNWINWLQFLHFTCRNPSVTLEQFAWTRERYWCSWGLWSQKLQVFQCHYRAVWVMITGKRSRPLPPVS